MKKKVALITGVTGQDGAYLAELLLKLGYCVYGGYRRSSTPNFWRLNALGVKEHSDFNMIDLDVLDISSIMRALNEIQPSEIYNLAAQSFVSASFKQPIATSEITGLGCANILESIRIINPNIRFYQASTSEMFGKVQESPQNEGTAFHPRSPYGVAKLYAHWMTINYREAYGIYACNGILFNHESPLRSIDFVTRKISSGVSLIKNGELKCLHLGNLNAMRDWGHAKDYVRAMHAMIQKDKPDDYVVATGRTETVRRFLEMAFESSGIDVEFDGENENEVVINKKSKKIIACVDEKFYRPSEVDILVGDATKANEVLGWYPTTTLEQLCHEMVKFDMSFRMGDFERKYSA